MWKEKSKLKIILILGIVGMASVLLGFKSADQYVPSNAVVRPIGRCQYIDNSLWLVQSGSGCEFALVGDGADITFLGDDTATQKNCKTKARIGVYVNGSLAIDTMIDALEKTVRVINPAPSQLCTVTVVKLSEAQYSTTAIKEIKLIGKSQKAIAPTDRKQFLIQYVGDSITCGYGVDGKYGDPFTTNTENVMKTYEAVLSARFNADWDIVGYSGFGIVSGSVEPQNETANVACTVPQYYNLLGVSKTNLRGKNPRNYAWVDYREPDIIVVNLGTNDATYTKNEITKCEQFAGGYQNFLLQIRAQHPASAIVCNLGVMDSDLCPYVQKAINATGDKNTYFVQSQEQTINDMCIHKHPSMYRQKYVADELTSTISKILLTKN